MTPHIETLNLAGVDPVTVSIKLSNHDVSTITVIHPDGEKEVKLNFLTRPHLVKWEFNHGLLKIVATPVQMKPEEFTLKEGLVSRQEIPVSSGLMELFEQYLSGDPWS